MVANAFRTVISVTETCRLSKGTICGGGWGTDPRRTTVGAADTCSSIFSEPNRHHLREFSLLTADVLLEEAPGEGRGIYTRVPSHSSPPVIGNFKRGLKEELEFTAGRDW